MTAFTYIAYILDSNHCWDDDYFRRSCSLDDKLYDWMFSKTSLVFLTFCLIFTIKAFFSQFQKCQRCKCIIAGEKCHKYRTKDYQYSKCCDQCDLKRGKSANFIRNTYYFKNGLCNFCHRDNFTRCYRIYSYLKMCSTCWMKFNR